MLKSGHVAVAGAGIAGLFTAWHLLRRGFQVTLLEGGEPGHGCTWDAAGMLAPVNELEFTEPELLQAGISAREMYHALVPELGDIGLITAGTLEVGLQADDTAWLRRLFEFQQAQGLDVHWLSGNEAREHEPLLSNRIPAAIWSPQDVQVDNRRLVQVLADQIQERGGKIRLHTAVKTWENLRDGGIRLLGHHYDALVLATGTGTVAQARPPVPVFPVRGEMISLVPPDYPFLQRTVRIRNKVLGNAYIVPKPGRILIGSTSEEKGMHAVNTAGGWLDILRKTYAAVPGIYELEVRETWAGLRPSTLDRLPVIAREAQGPVYHLNGLYRHGILLAPFAAAALCDYLMGLPLNPHAQAWVRA